MNLIARNIEILIKRRIELVDTYDESYDETICDYTIEEPKEINELENLIILEIFKHYNELDIDFIIETLTKLGNAPCILYDDNGHFAIESAGIQNVSFEDEPCNMDLYHHVEKDQWKPTIRKALKYYLQKYDSELWLKVYRIKKLKRIIERNNG